ncbi:MAG: ABC transporter ATP-binding protein [Deltaproteobacteria bacterium]|jgi:oligopeptide/dipeptide ABC transporter ATP-binding protein|nr:ABC transporter ATP-binding protein [Deltaproteobacteria bacterium]
MGDLLEIRNLKTYFHVRGALLKAVDDVTLNMKKGETLGLVGESGCGKSVTASTIMGLVPMPPGFIAGGEILFEGVDLVKIPESKMRKIRGSQISMIFQEPMTSLNPVFTVGDQVAEVIRLHEKLSRQEIQNRVIETFRLVNIPAPETRIKDYPHQMSGGMRQRVMIAMALACSPKLMIADEPTTALDVTIQAQILELMNTLKRETGASILFITHDLGVIAEMSQKVAVMYAGKVMEAADVNDLFGNPRHPYTVGLMSSIPVLGTGKKQKRLSTIAGVVPSLFKLPEGCLFHDRCTMALKDCSRVEPPVTDLGNGHIVCCHQCN